MPEITIYEKLYNVQQNIDHFPKNGWNAFGKYAYPLFEDLMQVVKPQLKEQGLYLLFDVENESLPECQPIEKKSVASFAVTAKVFDIKTGEMVSARCPCYSEDSNDKASFQAHTGGRKYALLALFGICAGDDPESTPSPNETKPKETKPKETKPKTDSII